MPRLIPRAPLRHFLQGLSSISLAIAGLSFFFGGRAIHEFGGVDRIFAEVMGIGIAVAIFFLGMIAKHKTEDLDWEEQNERAENEQKISEQQMKESRAESSKDP